MELVKVGIQGNLPDATVTTILTHQLYVSTRTRSKYRIVAFFSRLRTAELQIETETARTFCVLLRGHLSRVLSAPPSFIYETVHRKRRITNQVEGVAEESQR
jgi:hypothetical protein